MAVHFSHLHTATQIITRYTGQMPLAAFLKQFFARDKKFGSRDRRSISQMCYAFYRVNSAFAGNDLEDTIVRGLFLTEHRLHPLLTALQPDWAEAIGLPAGDKLAVMGIQAADLFPLAGQLSTGIHPEAFAQSFLVQPDLFIRSRPGKTHKIAQQLTTAGIAFTQQQQCFRMPNSTRLDDLLQLNTDYVVQDMHSQQTIGLLPPNLGAQPKQWWDCCAASGGKSLLAADRFPHLQLTVSDVRESILINLQKRFAAAGIKGYRMFEADLTEPAAVQQRFAKPCFDVIVCDAPCSGSGTWSRTPEQTSFFQARQIEQYAQLQQRIAANVLAALKPGGYLLYITCSAFAAENEGVVNYLLQHRPLTLVQSQVFAGYQQRADTMFAAVFQKNVAE